MYRVKHDCTVFQYIFRENSPISKPITRQKQRKARKIITLRNIRPGAALVNSDSSQWFCMMITVPTSFPGRLRTSWAALRDLSDPSPLPNATSRLGAALTSRCHPGSQKSENREIFRNFLLGAAPRRLVALGSGEGSERPRRAAQDVRRRPGTLTGTVIIIQTSWEEPELARVAPDRIFLKLFFFEVSVVFDRL